MYLFGGILIAMWCGINYIGNVKTQEGVNFYVRIGKTPTVYVLYEHSHWVLYVLLMGSLQIKLFDFFRNIYQKDHQDEGI